jgi:DNA-binding transcriptional MerR regulator
VLSLLTDDFPDVTISKIRFLESQGLIDPERTPSGYRKFYDSDIARLRWILRQQRDHFLPLKVIKAKMDDGTADVGDEGPAEPNLFTALDSPEVPPVSTAGERDAAAWLAALQEPPGASATEVPGPAPSAPSVPVRPLDPPTVRTADFSSTRYTLAELATTADVDPELIEQLVSYGLIAGSRFGGEDNYDDSTLEIVRAAAGFVSRGVEPRHLRAYRLAAERETALFEQLILPLLKQRNPQARQDATDALNELTELGESIRRSLIRQSLRTHLSPR